MDEIQLKIIIEWLIFRLMQSTGRFWVMALLYF